MARAINPYLSPLSRLLHSIHTRAIHFMYKCQLNSSLRASHHHLGGKVRNELSPSAVRPERRSVSAEVEGCATIRHHPSTSAPTEPTLRTNGDVYFQFFSYSSLLRALQKAGRANPVINFYFVFKQLKSLPGLLPPTGGRNDGKRYVLFEFNRPGIHWTSKQASNLSNSNIK